MILQYDAIYLPEGAPKPPGEIINQPELAVYISDFGQPDELCMVAEACGHILGAVWAKTDARLTCKTVFVRFSTWDVLFFYHKDTNTFDRYPISAIELQNIDMNARFLLELMERSVYEKHYFIHRNESGWLYRGQ